MTAAPGSVTKIETGTPSSPPTRPPGHASCTCRRRCFPFDLFVRCLGVGPQVNIIKYDPDTPLHDRYKVEFNVVDGAEWEHLVNLTLTINTFFGWDFN